MHRYNTAKISMLRALGDVVIRFREHMKWVMEERRREDLDPNWLIVNCFTQYDKNSDRSRWDVHFFLDADALDLPYDYKMGRLIKAQIQPTGDPTQILVLDDRIIDTVVAHMGRRGGTAEDTRIMGALCAHHVWQTFWLRNPNESEGSDVAIWHEKIAAEVYELFVNGKFTERGCFGKTSVGETR